MRGQRTPHIPAYQVPVGRNDTEHGKRGHHSLHVTVPSDSPTHIHRVGGVRAWALAGPAFTREGSSWTSRAGPMLSPLLVHPAPHSGKASPLGEDHHSGSPSFYTSRRGSVALKSWSSLSLLSLLLLRGRSDADGVDILGPLCGTRLKWLSSSSLSHVLTSSLGQ